MRQLNELAQQLRILQGHFGACVKRHGLRFELLNILKPWSSACVR